MDIMISLLLLLRSYVRFLILKGIVLIYPGRSSMKPIKYYLVIKSTTVPTVNIPEEEDGSNDFSKPIAKLLALRFNKLIRPDSFIVFRTLLSNDDIPYRTFMGRPRN